MFKKLIVVLWIAILLALPLGRVFAQDPTPTSGGFGNFFDAPGTATPTTSSLGNASANATPSPTPNPVAQALAKNNYLVIDAGPWYDAQGKRATDSVYVMMRAVSPDPKSNDSVKQITSGLAALRNQYPTAATYRVLLLNGPYVYDAFTTSKTLQLLNSQLLTPENFIQDLLAQMRSTNLAGSATTSTAVTATATRASGAATATRVPTRKPTTASNCNPPAGMARLFVKNGYSGVMRFSIGAPDVGFQKDFDIPSDGQFHYVDLPPSSKYTYSASIPGVGKASQRLADIFGPFEAGKCYSLPFQP